MYLLDHVVVGVRSLRAAAETFRRSLGFSVLEGGRHVGRGTCNMLIDFGGPYLELISVFDEQEAIMADRGRLVEYLRTRGGGFVAYALQADDIDELAQRIHAAGLEATGPFSMRRVQADGREVSWRLLIPGGNQYRALWPFFIQWDVSPEGCAGTMASGCGHPNGAVSISELDVVVEDLGRASEVYESVFGLAPEEVSSASAALCVSYLLGNSRITLHSPTTPSLRQTVENDGEGPFQVSFDLSNKDSLRRWLQERYKPEFMAEANDFGVLIDFSAVDFKRLIMRSHPNDDVHV